MPGFNSGIMKKIALFYGKDCCWPYALSFFLVLIMYVGQAVCRDSYGLYMSAVAYLVLFSYYLYNVRLYKRGKLTAYDLPFFIRFLTFKIVIWFLLLLFVFFLTVKYGNGRLF